jgi:hypothetical protein
MTSRDVIVASMVHPTFPSVTIAMIASVITAIVIPAFPAVVASPIPAAVPAFVLPGVCLPNIRRDERKSEEAHKQFQACHLSCLCSFCL